MTREQQVIRDFSAEIIQLRDEVTKLRVDNERLKNTLKLHAGDCMSLDNEITLLRENAADKNAEVERLKEHVATLQALRELDRVMIAELRAVLEPKL